MNANTLPPVDVKPFQDAAVVFMAQQERLEMIGQQGGKAQPSQQAITATNQLVQLLLEFRQRHAWLHGLRFLGRIWIMDSTGRS